MGENVGNRRGDVTLLNEPRSGLPGLLPMYCDSLKHTHVLMVKPAFLNQGTAYGPLGSQEAITVGPQANKVT